MDARHLAGNAIRISAGCAGFWAGLAWLLGMPVLGALALFVVLFILTVLPAFRLFTSSANQRG